MSARAGIVVTGTEVLTGRVSDRNGPWLAEELRRRGVDVAEVIIVGDRPGDLLHCLQFLADEHVDLIITSGGLGPTADDLTAAVVADFQERPLTLDTELEARIAAIVEQLMRSRAATMDPQATAVATAQQATAVATAQQATAVATAKQATAVATARQATAVATAKQATAVATAKQAMVPAGATALGPTGTAPGLVVPPPTGKTGRPPVLVLPGPPPELQAMWPEAMAEGTVQAALKEAREIRQQTIRLWGPPESELAAVMRQHADELTGLEITTCLHDGELEIVTRFDRSQQGSYRRFADLVEAAFGDTPRSLDGRTVDEIVAAELITRGRTIATAESCTGGLLAARLTDQPGSSAYVVGGVVAYANAAKESMAGVDPALIERFGAVSAEVAAALAAGARSRFGADLGVGVTGVAGPDGGSSDKPVGLVHLCLAVDGQAIARVLRARGSRADVRTRAVVTAMYMIQEVVTR